MDSELKYEKASFGGITFCASQHGNEECGANGLPLTLNSTRILGAFQFLKSLQHPHLASYLHLRKGKKERVFVVSEHHDKCLFDLDVSNLHGSKVCHLFYQTISALSYLNEKGISHCFITPQSIFINKSNQVLLSNYGLHHMTECGTAVSFPIGHPKYSSPESLLKLLIHKKDISKNFGLDSNDETDGAHETSSDNENCDQNFANNHDDTNYNNINHNGDIINKGILNNSDKTGSKSINIADMARDRYDGGHKGDVWSVALVYLQLVMGLDLWKELGLKELIRTILMFAKNKDLHPMDSILKDHNKSINDLNKKWGEAMIKTLKDCLNLKPSQRPSADDLLRQKLFSSFVNVVDTSEANSISVVTSFKQFSHSELKHNVKISDTPCSQLPQNEVFYLWTLAGGDMENTLKNRIDTSPPIFSLPAYIRRDGEGFGSTFDRSSLFDATPVVLSLNNITNKLKDMTAMGFFPSFSNKKKIDKKPLCKLSYSVREKDFQYQFHRIVRMRRLLAAYPWHRSAVVTECSLDIPPLYRPHIWAVILNVQGDLLREYEMIDKDSPSQTDRQIEVDIPRCHQYNALLSSPAAHHKFKRLLKAWVTRHQNQYVYWQGLDSLLAPFLYLHFNDEALAFACFTNFIEKYLHNFFYKDNSLIIQEYLAVFSHMISFHDPQLASHLHTIGFIPDLYSIPWFLTMYAHVFPLHNIFHLWDSLLMGDTSYPLCVGVAILKQLRKQLLSFGFNECILLFSDMPEIDMELCVTESLAIFKSTPKSCTYRKHSIHPPHLTQHSPPVTHLSRSDVPLSVIKTEVYPRISVEDLINFMALSSASAMLQGSCKAVGCENKKDANKSVLVIDVRDRSSFISGCIPTSFNVPFNIKHSGSANDIKNDAPADVQHNKGDNNGNNNELPENLVRLLEGSLKNYIKVFVGECGKENVKKMAEKAIKEGYNRVCVLDGGVEVMRTEGFLVPASDVQLNHS